MKICYTEFNDTTAPNARWWDGSNSGTIKSGECVFVQTRFAKVDWSGYNQSNDISFDGSSSTYEANENVSLYVDGTRVWGNL